MIYLPYIIVLTFIAPVIYTGLKRLSYLLLNRNYLQNRNIQDKLHPFVMKALNKYKLDGFNPSEYTNIRIINLDNESDLIEVELFILNNYELIRRNPVEKLIKIKGYKYKGKYLIKSLEDYNSKDIGSIIPNVSNIPLNRLFRNRRWGDHKKYWNLYKKDWDIKWMDKAI